MAPTTRSNASATVAPAASRHISTKGANARKAEGNGRQAGGGRKKIQAKMTNKSAGRRARGRRASAGAGGGSGASKRTANGRRGAASASEELIIVGREIEYVNLDYATWNAFNCFNREPDEPDWSALFPPNPTAGAGAGRCLSPRMAFRLCDEAVVLSDETWMLELPRLALPSLARCFYGASREWNYRFCDSFRRIALRLRRGRDPTPNCVAEVVALRSILKRCMGHDPCDVVPLTRMEDGDCRVRAIPATDRDDDFVLVESRCFDPEDMIVLTLLFDGEDDGDDNDDDDSDSVSESSLSNFDKLEFYAPSSASGINVLTAPLDHLEYLAEKFEENARKFPVARQGRDASAEISYARRLISKLPGLLAEFSFESGRDSYLQTSKLLNLHPNRWFIAFRENDLKNHL